MSFAAVFAGQGTQHAAMLPWVRDDDVVRAMCAQLEVDDWRHAAEDDAWSARNGVAQVLLTGLSVAAWRQLSVLLPEPIAVAGYSVGEVAAFCAAGVYASDVALRLARDRATAMDRAAREAPGGLLAVSGLPVANVERLCADSGAAIAIRNGEDSFVVGGGPEALDIAERIGNAQGARCTRLRVGVASHTACMTQASAAFLAELQEVPFAAPRTPLFSNATGARLFDAGTAKKALAAQISSTVRWDECMDAIRSRQVSCVVEIGAGTALSRLWNDRYPDIPARSGDDFRSVSALADWVRKLDV